MGLRIDANDAALVSYRNLSVPNATVESTLARARGPVAEPAPAVSAQRTAGDSVETRHSPAPLPSALRSAQESMGRNEEAGRALGRAREILVQLNSLVAQGLVQGHRPADTAVERRYVALVNQLAELGTAAPPYDKPLPTRVDLGEVAERLTASRGSGIDAALTTVDQARSEVESDHHALGQALGALLVARENNLAAQTRITDLAMAQEASSLARAGILGNPRSAVAAQSRSSEDARRLLQV